MKVAIIGSGISGLAAAAVLAKQGHDVSILEKNEHPGGRIRILEADGFRFDMGPSWYWMPDVFEDFYNQFGKTTGDLYQLLKLSPGFRIFFKDEVIDIPAEQPELFDLFNRLEENGAEKIKAFLKSAEYKYRTGMGELVYNPSYSLFEYLNVSTIKALFRLTLLSSMRTYVSANFKNEKIKAILEFPVLFLGGLPENTPALYSLLNHAQLTQGTFYPDGGMYRITKAMVNIAEDHGVKVQTSTSVESIIVKGNKVTGLNTSGDRFSCDYLIGSSDYAHTETLLEESYRNYKHEYWQQKTFAPSCLLFFVGVRKKLDGLQHHNLFFDTDFGPHADSIYQTRRWPDTPQFYVCCPSKTDSSVAPEGMENLFILIPVAINLVDSDEIRERYFHSVIKRIEERTESFSSDIIVRRSYSIKDFKKNYNAYGGNAYGLANTLRQTAFMKPSVKNKKLDNMFYCGHLTVPGPGLPPSLISGQIAAREVLKSAK